MLAETCWNWCTTDCWVLLSKGLGRFVLLIKSVWKLKGWYLSILSAGTLGLVAAPYGYEIAEAFLDGGFKYFLFHPYLGKIPILTNIFQMGWNHQLGFYHVQILQVISCTGAGWPSHLPSRTKCKQKQVQGGPSVAGPAAADWDNFKKHMHLCRLYFFQRIWQSFSNFLPMKDSRCKTSVIRTLGVIVEL